MSWRWLERERQHHNTVMKSTSPLGFFVSQEEPLPSPPSALPCPAPHRPCPSPLTFQWPRCPRPPRVPHSCPAYTSRRGRVAHGVTTIDKKVHQPAPSPCSTFPLAPPSPASPNLPFLPAPHPPSLLSLSLFILFFLLATC